jgi:hypothetical protein
MHIGMYLCAAAINFTYAFYDISIGFWNRCCSMVFSPFHFIRISV